MNIYANCTSMCMYRQKDERKKQAREFGLPGRDEKVALVGALYFVSTGGAATAAVEK